MITRAQLDQVVVTKDDVDEAVSYIEESLDSHTKWVDYINDYPEELKESVPRVEVSGDMEHQLMCISHYEHTLAVLATYPSITLDTFQKEHLAWRVHNFWGSPDYHPILGVAEEFGEFCHAILKMEQNIRGTKEEHVAKAKDSIGDMLVYMVDICNRNGWQLQEILETTWKEVKSRDWTKNRLNGQLREDQELVES